MAFRYTNCKFNSDIVNKILDSDITSAQIDVLLWLSLRQDVFGRIFNVKYYDICNEVGISHQQYYDCIDKLEQMSFIRVFERSYKHGWDIEILNNINLNKESDKQRYLNTNVKLFFKDDFKKLRANEKKILFKILLEKANRKQFYLYISTLSKWLNISNVQLIKSYMDKIKTFFNISFYNKTKLFIVKDEKCNIAQGFLSEFSYFFRYKLRILCRSMKILIENENIFEDIITIFHQYKNNIHISILYNIVISSLEKLKKLEPPFINWSVQQYIKQI